MSPGGAVQPELGAVLLACLLALLVTISLGLLRALRGPALEDRLAAILLLGTGGVGMLLLLALLMGMPALFDVALLLALLAAVVAAAATQREAGE